MRISVVIPVYNGGQFIERCLTSVLSQDTGLCDLEVIVQDNSSSDNTMQLAVLFDDPRVRIFSTDHKLTAAQNWSSVCAKASGDFIKLLPVDDTLLPGALAEQSNVLLENVEIAFVSSWRQVTTSRGRKLPRFVGSLLPGGEYSAEDIALLASTSPRNFFGEPGCVLFRSNVLNRCLPWSDSAGYALELELYLRAIAFGKVRVLEKLHSTFQLTGGSLSSKASNSQVTDTLKVIENYLQDSRHVSNVLSKALKRRISNRSNLRRLAYRLFS